MASAANIPPRAAPNMEPSFGKVLYPLSLPGHHCDIRQTPLVNQHSASTSSIAGLTIRGRLQVLLQDCYLAVASAAQPGPGPHCTAGPSFGRTQPHRPLCTRRLGYVGFSTRASWQAPLPGSPLCRNWLCGFVRAHLWEPCCCWAQSAQITGFLKPLAHSLSKLRTSSLQE